MVKNLLKYFFVSFSLLNFTLSFCNTNYKELIITIDYHKAETIYHTLNNKNTIGLPQGCGAITLGTLVAFEQESAPMVLSKSIWENIYAHREIFQDFCNLSLRDLIKKYKKFNRFDNQKTIQQFKQVCIYFKNIYPKIKQEIKSLLKNSNNSGNNSNFLQKVFIEITNNPKFGYAQAPKSLNNYHFDHESRDIYIDAAIFFICDYVVNKIKNWTIKEIDNNNDLFIPNNYIKELNLKDLNNISDKITKTELQLGLKVNHLKNIDYRQNITLKANTIAGIEFDRTLKFVPVLDKIFVNNQEYKQNNSNTIPQWIIYLDGHGLSSYSIKKELRKFQKIKNHYDEILNKKFKCCHKAEQNKTLNKHLAECSLSYEYQQIRPDIIQINNAIKSIETNIQNKKNPLEGTIISLPVSEFKNVLEFFNNNINTEFIYYSSCYAGGEHLVTPYLDNNNKPLKLNYYVTVGTLSENISQLEVPCMPLPPYQDYKMNPYTIDPEESIDIEKKDIKFCSALDFNSFFKLIKNNKHKSEEIYKAIACVNPYTYKNGKLKKGCIGNLPSVRKPKQDSFEFIIGLQKIALIENNKTIDNSYDLILLNNKNIKSININKVNQDSIPPIVSVVPGETAHNIETLNARNFTLTEVINAFSQLPKFAGSKIFKIKKLIVKNSKELSKLAYSKTVTLENFIISHKVHDTNNINKMKKNLSINMPTSDELITGIYFGIKNLAYSIKWVGEQISNLFFKQVSKKKEKMLLAYHEELSEKSILG